MLSTAVTFVAFVALVTLCAADTAAPVVSTKTGTNAKESSAWILPFFSFKYVTHRFNSAESKYKNSRQQNLFLESTKMVLSR
jgi:hypothetical protein